MWPSVAAWGEDMWYGRRATSPFVGATLRACARAWSAAVKLRGALSHPRPSVTLTIGISSPVVGGSGKTPLTRWIAVQLEAQGHTPAIVSRGHGGRLTGPVRVDITHHEANEVGDEPLWLASSLPTIPVVISRMRADGVAYAARNGASIAVLDDALMLRALRLDMELMVLGTAGWIGNGACLPAGPLRMPARVIARAHGLVVITDPGTSFEEWQDRAQRLAGSIPVFPARMRPCRIVSPVGTMREVHAMATVPVVAWSGIARSWRFHDMLVDMGVDIRGFVSFPDHHRYSRRDLDRLARQVDALDAIPLTTAKDAARWPSWARWMPHYIDVELEFDDAGPLSTLLTQHLEECSHGRAAH